MTPDRNDSDERGAPDNGVLGSDSAFGALPARTEQVSVILPSGHDDDVADDAVLADEIAPAGLRPATGAHPVTAEAEIIDDADGPASAVRGDVEIVDAETVEALPPTATAPAPAAVTAARSTPSAASTSTGPLTRRQTFHPDQPAPDRSRDLERVTPPVAGVPLTSRRIGEIDTERESADLLTADRLLDPGRVARPEPEGAWRSFVYAISGRRINLGDGRRARARKELDRRISAPLAGAAKFVPVLSRKGGVGKTTVTTLLGMALADARDDRVVAVDANPDRGTLAERIARASGRTVRDLVRRRGEITGYHELSAIVSRDVTRLDVLASDADPRVSEAFSDRDYHDVASLAAHYYSIVLTDTGTGIVHSVMGATLDLADQIVVVAGLSVDEARLASETLTWLETNGYAERVRGAVVVLNSSRPGSPMVRRDELVAHFRSRVRAIVHIPYDPLIAAGSAIVFRDLQPATRDAAREVAAEVIAGLRQVASAA